MKKSDPIFFGVPFFWVVFAILCKGQCILNLSFKDALLISVAKRFVKCYDCVTV